MGKAGPGLKPAFAKTWSKVFVPLRLTDTVRMEFSQVALGFRRQDMRGVVDCWSGTPSLRDEIFFLGLGRVFGVGIAYVTSFEYFASFSYLELEQSASCFAPASVLFVVAAYVSDGAGFGGVSNLGYGAGCG